MATDRKIDPPHFDEHGRFIHPCCICGEEAGLGFGVSLLKGQLAHGTAENVCHSDRATITVASRHRKARPQRGD